MTRRASSSSSARRVMRDWPGASFSSDRSPAQTYYPRRTAGLTLMAKCLLASEAFRRPCLSRFKCKISTRQIWQSSTKQARGPTSLSAEKRLTVYRRPRLILLAAIAGFNSPIPNLLRILHFFCRSVTFVACRFVVFYCFSFLLYEKYFSFMEEL